MAVTDEAADEIARANGDTDAPALMVEGWIAANPEPNAMVVDNASVVDVETAFRFLIENGAVLDQRKQPFYGGIQLIYRHRDMDVRITSHSYGPGASHEISVDVSLPGRDDWWSLTSLGSYRPDWLNYLLGKTHRIRVEWEAGFLLEYWTEIARRLRNYRPGFVPPPY